MKRRTFLQQAGVLLTGATTVAAAQAEEPQGRSDTPDGHRPTILPSRCEVFFILGDIPQQKFLNAKAKRILGFKPEGNVALLWQRPEQPEP